MGEIARDALVAHGRDGGLVADGAEALRAGKARRPALLVLDCNMREKSGVMVLRELRNSPAFYDLPVMMLTGRRSTRHVELAMFAGADGYTK